MPADDMREPEVLLRHGRWICIDKPEGWHSVDARDSDGSPTVQSWLRAHEPACAALEESGLVHRLDKWTGGCLLAATDSAARATLRDAFSGHGPHQLRKWYSALVVGGIREEGEWTMHFGGRYARSAKVTAVRAGDARTAGTCRWRVMASLPEGSRLGSGARATCDVDLLDVELVGPGRRHQIRAGFAACGHPLAGDALYGGPALPGRGTECPALHARTIEVDGTLIEAACPSWALV